MRKNLRIVMMWILGSIVLLIGAMIAGNVQPGLGVNETGIALALIIALVLFLLGGLLWISVAVAVKKTGEA